MCHLRARVALLVGTVAVASALSAAFTTAWLGRDAHAQPAGATVILVPAQGIVFRGANGRVVARLRGDAFGGALELLDAREDVAVRLQATAAGGTIDLRTMREPRSQPLQLVRTLPDDPGY
jgi:hypothetical protein